MLFHGVVTGALVQLSLPLGVVHDAIERAADWGIPFLLKKHESWSCSSGLTESNHL